MTNDRRDPGSVQDIPFLFAQDRIADLRASNSRPDQEPAQRAAASPGVVARTRDALGRRLITLGGSLVADEALRRRAMHR